MKLYAVSENAGMLVANDGSIAYRYVCDRHDPDISCEFSMLCEVGAVYQRQFRDFIAERHWCIQTRRILVRPWMSDAIINYRSWRRTRDGRAIDGLSHEEPTDWQDDAAAPAMGSDGR